MSESARPCIFVLVMKKKYLFIVLALVQTASVDVCLSAAENEDGSRLWLRHEVAGAKVCLMLDPTVDDDEGYVIEGDTVRARTERGLLYGSFAWQTTCPKPIS